MALRVLIAGGGIGGLAAGIALRRAGCHVQVFERAPALAEVGAGISLWANAMRALDSLGLADSVRAIGMAAAGGLRRPDGRLLSAGPTNLLDRVPDFCLVIHRAELHALLIGALGPAQLRLGARVARIDPRGDAVSIVLDDGERVEGDVLIGADGLRSVVRSTLHGASPPHYAGYTAWRGVTAMDPGALQVGETWGAGKRFGQVPLTQGRVYWFAAANVREGARSHDGERALLGRMFRGWHRPIEALIDATAESEILRNDIYDRPPVEAWGRGRITLLGDAAHPMTPNLGQGACQALEDAVALARCLSREPDPESALRGYERLRRARTDAIVRESRQVGRVAQWEHPIAVRVRDVAMRALPARLQARMLLSLVSYDVSSC